MERHHRQPAARLQCPLGRHQARLEFRKLVIDRDSKGLENPRGRMNPGAATPAEGVFHCFGEIGRPLERPLHTAPHDFGRQATGLTLLAELPKDAPAMPAMPGGGGGMGGMGGMGF